MSLLKIITIVLLVSLMLQTGLQMNRANLRTVLRDYGLLGRALLANVILVPAFALLLVRAFHLDEFVAIGILLMAISPGVPFLPRAAGRTAGGSLGFAVALSFIMPAVSIVTAPLSARLLFPADAVAHVPVGQIIVTLAIFQLVPMLIGMLVAERAPAVAAKLVKPLMLLVAVFILVLLVVLAPALMKSVSSVYGSYAIIAAFLVVVFSLGTGWVLGGPQTQYRHTLAIATALRNIGLASLVATLNFPGTTVAAAVMTYFIVQILAGFLAGKYFARGLKAHAVATG